MSDQTKRESILKKVKKCLALSASSNEHEAEAALRQARKLMEQHGVTDAEVVASCATEHRARSNVKRTPPAWEAFLAERVAQAFGCDVIHVRSYFEGSSWRFIGCGSAPEVGGYAFEVLLRKVKRARANYIGEHLRHYGRSTKTRRADLFCNAWVHTVVGKVDAFARPVEQAAAIDAYTRIRYPMLKNGAANNRNAGRKMSSAEYADWEAGSSAAEDVQLHHGVGAEQRPALESPATGAE